MVKEFPFFILKANQVYTILSNLFTVNKYYFTNIQNKKYSFICIAEYVSWENSEDQKIVPKLH